jgi:hypothetical protein
MYLLCRRNRKARGCFFAELTFLIVLKENDARMLCHQMSGVLFDRMMVLLFCWFTKTAF